MKKITAYLVLLGAIGTTSCSILDVEPESQWGSANFFKTESHLTAALNGGYDNLQTALGYNFVLYGDARSDIYTLYNPNATVMERALSNDLNADMAQASWGIFYKVIQQANLVLKYTPELLEKGAVTPESAKNLIGQAHCMRAYTYFWIIRIWGDAPLVLEPYNDAEGDFTLERTPEADIRQVIHDDLEATRANINGPGADKALFSGFAATAIEAQLYAWEHQWAQVYSSTQTLLNSTASKPFNSPHYTLASLFDETINRYSAEFIPSVMPNLAYAKMFNGRAGSETIFELAYNIDDMENNDVLFAYVADSYPQIAPRIEYIGEFEPEDWRKDVTFGGGDRVTKFFVGYVKSQTARNIVLLRLSEIGLLRAEANAHLMKTEGDPVTRARYFSDAVGILNALRERAGGQIMSYQEPDYSQWDEDMLLEKILLERKLELGVEGYRYFDLIRFGKVFDVMAPLNGQTDARSLVWPIHLDEVRDSKGLIEQNEYYK